MVYSLIKAFNLSHTKDKINDELFFDFGHPNKFYGKKLKVTINQNFLLVEGADAYNWLNVMLEC